MREAFISILVLAIFAQAKCSDIGKDGFNYYKGTMRAMKNETKQIIYERVQICRKALCQESECFLYPSLLPALEQEYKKRTVNAFKNHMLNKELWTDGEMPGKRSSKTGLALLMQNKQPYYIIERPSGNVEVS